MARALKNSVGGQERFPFKPSGHAHRRVRKFADHIDLTKAVLSLSEARLLFGVDEAKLSLGAG